MEIAKDLDALWDRLTHVSASVRRVVGSVVFLDLDGRGSATVRRVEGWEPRLKDTIEVAGTLGPRGAFTLALGRIHGTLHVLGLPANIRHLFQAASNTPSVRPPWLDALVRHGLIDSVEAVQAKWFDDAPIGILCSLHRAREAVAKGFVHYDWKWLNDTENVIDDFARIAGVNGMFHQAEHSARADTLTFDVSVEGGTIREVVKDVSEGLGAIGGRMNSWLERAGAPRRIYEWTTGADRIAFLGRTPAEVQALQTDLPVPSGLSLCGTPEARGDEVDFSDV
jgi:hypothetical protein